MFSTLLLHCSLICIYHFHSQQFLSFLTITPWLAKNPENNLPSLTLLLTAFYDYFQKQPPFFLQKGVLICWLLEALKAFFNGTNVMIKLVLFESTHFTKQYHSKVINFLFLVWESFSQFNWLNKKVRINDKNFQWPFFSKLFSYLIRQKFQGLGNDKKTCSCRQFISSKGKLLP